MLQQLINSYLKKQEDKNRDYFRGFEIIQNFIDNNSFFQLNVLPDSIEELNNYKDILQPMITEEENQGSVIIYLAGIDDCESEYFYTESLGLEYIKAQLPKYIKDNADKLYFETNINIRPIKIFTAEISDYFSGKQLEQALIYFKLENF